MGDYVPRGFAFTTQDTGSDATDSDVRAAGNSALFTANAGDLSGQSFLVVDSNGTAGYQAGQDLVIQLDTAAHVGSLSIADFI